MHAALWPIGHAWAEKRGSQLPDDCARAAKAILLRV
jgi:hypothetical protein